MNFRKLLLAVNDTDVSMKAVKHVGEMCAGLEQIEICLLHVTLEAPPNYHLEGHGYDEYVSAQNEKAQKVFAEAMTILSQHNIKTVDIKTKTHISAKGETICQAILKEQAEGAYGTVVLGKRGVSRAEEFLFGSISNAVVQKCTFAVWVVA